MKYLILIAICLLSACAPIPVYYDNVDGARPIIVPRYRYAYRYQGYYNNPYYDNGRVDYYYCPSRERWIYVR